jgi:hypothetical protein
VLSGVGSFCAGAWGCGAVWRGVVFCGAGRAVGSFCAGAWGGVVWGALAGEGVTATHRL